MGELARAAATGFKSPVYWGTVTAPASAPVDGQRLAFHAWDTQAAFKAWDGNPTLGVRGKTPVYSYYKPTAADEAFGERIRAVMVKMLLDGRLPEEEWQQIRAGQLAVSSVVGPTSTLPVPGLKAELCDFWTSNGVGENWWWIN